MHRSGCCARCSSHDGRGCARPASLPACGLACSAPCALRADCKTPHAYTAAQRWRRRLQRQAQGESRLHAVTACLLAAHFIILTHNCTPTPPQELLRELEALGEAELAAWAAANRERLSLPFLGWLSDEELEAAAGEPQRQQALWELGSRLMALREGLAPVANEVLQAELRAAALRCSGDDSSGSGTEGEQGGAAEADAADAQRRQRRLQDAAHQQAQRAQQGAAAPLASPSFASAVQRTAALGLSPEGMQLFQQQAAALEAVVGTSRARSLTQVIGRARVQDARQVQRLAESDAAVRWHAMWDLQTGLARCHMPELAAGKGCWRGLPRHRICRAFLACRPQTLVTLLLPLPRFRLPPCGTAQVRILEVLLSVHDRHARAAMLPDAFTPPGSTAGAARQGVQPPQPCFSIGSSNDAPCCLGWRRRACPLLPLLGVHSAIRPLRPLPGSGGRRCRLLLS